MRETERHTQSVREEKGGGLTGTFTSGVQKPLRVLIGKSSSRKMAKRENLLK